MLGAARAFARTGGAGRLSPRVDQERSTQTDQERSTQTDQERSTQTVFTSV